MNENEEVFIPSVKRKVTSVYLDPIIWKRFMAKTKTLGTSTCQILEAFMYAFNRGAPDHPVPSLPTVNVNLVLNRVVQRHHRVEKEWGGIRKKRIPVVNSRGQIVDIVDAYPMDENRFEKKM